MDVGIYRLPAGGLRRAADGHAHAGHNPITDRHNYTHHATAYGDSRPAQPYTHLNFHADRYFYAHSHAGAANVRADRPGHVRRQLVAGRALFQLRLADE